jgi:hypothetical protein
MKRYRLLFLSPLMAMLIIFIISFQVNSAIGPFEEHNPPGEGGRNYISPMSQVNNKALDGKDISANPDATNTIFLPGVLLDYAPCIVVPNLISPANGSTVNTLTPILTFDGGSETQPNATWLEVDLSTDPEFKESYPTFPHIYQPAQKLWVYEISEDNPMEPGIYYWRAALWCNGPGWPPPPNPGEILGQYSQTQSFTVTQP